MARDNDVPSLFFRTTRAVLNRARDALVFSRLRKNSALLALNFGWRSGSPLQ